MTLFKSFFKVLVHSAQDGLFGKKTAGSEDFMEAVFLHRSFRTFSGNFRPVPDGKGGEVTGKVRGGNTASSDSSFFPSGYGDFSSNFPPVPSVSCVRNHRSK